jgi:hypothetical protein
MGASFLQTGEGDSSMNQEEVSYGNVFNQGDVYFFNSTGLVGARTLRRCR